MIMPFHSILVCILKKSEQMRKWKKEKRKNRNDDHQNTNTFFVYYAQFNYTFSGPFFHKQIPKFFLINFLILLKILVLFEKKIFSIHAYLFIKILGQLFRQLEATTVFSNNFCSHPL